MKTFIIKLMIIIPSVISMMKTPMSMGVMLMMQTFLSTMFMAKIMGYSWMPMTMFIMLIGGLMILFMYMSSIASNEKFKMNIFMSIFPLLIMLMMMEEMTIETQNETNLSNLIINEQKSMNFIFMKKYFMITVLIFMMLLLTMISVVFIMKIHKGPLRSKTYE
uniref:NADH dehydrogenase subunit 6 n=1 Tax=Penthimia melanocephala TaxID=2777567 RepID=A0A7L8UVD6_9HEMI|nr:NADH dehydrogenase subunit 6 [Penthimia melanocephala]QOG08898.1 NADH dehydrogenase subunit 6 [Penthimia melanocephala]